MKPFLRFILVAVIAGVACVFAQRVVRGRVSLAVTGGIAGATAVAFALTGNRNRKTCPECSAESRPGAVYFATCGGKFAAGE